MVKKLGLGNAEIAGDLVKWEHIICAVIFSCIDFAFVDWLALPMEGAPRDILEGLGP